MALILGTCLSLMCIVFLVYIVRGLKQSSMELGLQQNQSIAAWGFLFCLFVSFVFIIFLPILATSLPLGHAEFSKSSSISPDLWAHWFWLSDKCSTTDRTCLPSLLTAHLKPKLHIPVAGPPSSLTFQFTIFSHLGHGSVFLLDLWWVFLLLWVQASEYSGTLIGLSLSIWYRSRYLSRKVSTLLSLYLVIILNPQSHLIYAQFIITAVAESLLFPYIHTINSVIIYTIAFHTNFPKCTIYNKQINGPWVARKEVELG